MTVLMNVLISMGPVVEVNSFTIDDQTSYGVAIRIAGAGTRTRPFSRVVEQQELTFSLDEFAGISPGALSLQPDDDGPEVDWDLAGSIAAGGVLFGAGSGLVNSVGSLFNKIGSGLAAEEDFTLYAELGGVDAVDWAGLTLDIDLREEDLRPWIRFGLGWGQSDLDSGTWYRGGVGMRWLIAEEMELDVGWNFVESDINTTIRNIGGRGLQFGVRFGF